MVGFGLSGDGGLAGWVLVIIRRSDEIMVGAGVSRVEMTQNLLEFLIEMRSVSIDAAALPGEAVGQSSCNSSVSIHLFSSPHSFCLFC